MFYLFEKENFSNFVFSKIKQKNDYFLPIIFTESNLTSEILEY